MGALPTQPSPLSAVPLRVKYSAGIAFHGPPVTLGHMRAHGVRRLLIYCCTGLCHHSATIVPLAGRNRGTGFVPESSLLKMWHDRRGRAAGLDGTSAAGELDRDSMERFTIAEQDVRAARNEGRGEHSVRGQRGRLRWVRRRGFQTFRLRVPLRSRVHLISRGDVQVMMLDRLHPWVARPEAIVHAESGKARGVRDPVAKRRRGKYQGE